MAETGDFDWDDLRYFLRAMQAKTLAGAARAMRVEHTTVGRRLSALERALGAPLVLRGPDGLQLTPLGEQALPLVEEVERAVAKIRALVASQRSRVRLAVPSGFTPFFTEGLARLRAKHPELSLEIVSGSRPVDLKKGEADVALRSGLVADDDLVARKLGVSGWSLYASDAYLARKPGEIDPDDLSEHEIIGYDASLSSVPAAKWIEERATKARIVLRSREMTDMLAAAVSGVGLAVLPCSLADGETTLRRLTPKVVATRDIFLVYRREARLSAEVRAVIQFVADVMREHADRLSGVVRE
jgi:DNA-binding transcriptional LysR family regulator